MEQKTKKPISKSLIKRLHIIYSAQGIDDEQKAGYPARPNGRTDKYHKRVDIQRSNVSLRLFERCEKRKQGFDYHRTGNKEAQVGCSEESAADRNRHNGLGSGKCVLP